MPERPVRVRIDLGMTVDNRYTIGAFAVIVDGGHRVLLSHRRASAAVCGASRAID